MLLHSKINERKNGMFFTGNDRLILILLFLLLYFFKPF